MNAEKIKEILLENEFRPSEANKISNLIHNHLVTEDSYLKNPGEYETSIYKATTEIEEEVFRAKKMFPKNFVNPHEAYAVILEEVDELWAEIKKNQSQYNIHAQRKEAVQAAAMLVRFIVELTNTETK